MCRPRWYLLKAVGESLASKAINVTILKDTNGRTLTATFKFSSDMFVVTFLLLSCQKIASDLAIVYNWLDDPKVGQSICFPFEAEETWLFITERTNSTFTDQI